LLDLLQEQTLPTESSVQQLWKPGRSDIFQLPLAAVLDNIELYKVDSQNTTIREHHHQTDIGEQKLDPVQPNQH